MKPANKKAASKRSARQPDFDFSGVLIAWQKRHGRHALPWQQTRDAYRIWLSEIMLQQTQVTTVIPYYARFLAYFPDVAALASAPAEAVMAQWSGLGYYSRARNLHRCAQIVVEKYGGHFPVDPALLEALPGIGRSTAAAISVFSSGTRAAILDGNVIRVLSRVFGIEEYAGATKVKNRLWQLAESLLPEQDLESYTQGLMDLGATICVRGTPSCDLCPFSSCCYAFLQDKVRELPVRKPSKTLPERHVCLLVAIHKNRVLLEKRPASGIWGGLFSLPELPGSESDIHPAMLNKVLGPFGHVDSLQWLGGFIHTFTHFRLHIVPILMTLSKTTRKMPDERYVWYDMAGLDNAPLPAPVRKLLEGVKLIV
ncbi:MAG: A/G-specific adenine glycosylase [Oxalobacter sp.]|nr:A/G-specific adenine glycosylase [Oxalobacter sp.]